MKLISFTIENFHSFLNTQTIEFDRDQNNVDIFVGPNNSGKSNIQRAIAVFKHLAQRSTAFDSSRDLITPFAFNVNSTSKPTTLSATMQIRDRIYLYKFSYLDGKVVDESLKLNEPKKGGTYTTLFSRASIVKNRYVNYGFNTKLLKDTRDDALVLTKAYENNNQFALEVFEWLDHIRFMSGIGNLRNTAKKVSEDTDFKDKVLNLLKRADIHIQDLESTKVPLPDDIIDQIPQSGPSRPKSDRNTYDVKTVHMIYDDAGRVVKTKSMPLYSESTGTKRIFELAYPIIDALENGHILYIDEFETFLHPRECKLIVQLFKSNEENRNSAQLILNTHNSQLIDLVGRDSVHLVGKDNREQTIVGGISKKIRSDDQSLERKYHKGLFGAVPNVG